MSFASSQDELAAELGISIQELNSILPCYVNQCGGHFVVRTNRKNGSKFFGCSNYPECTATRNWIIVIDELGAKVIGHIDHDEPYFGM